MAIYRVFANFLRLTTHSIADLLFHAAQRAATARLRARYLRSQRSPQPTSSSRRPSPSSTTSSVPSFLSRLPTSYSESGRGAHGSTRGVLCVGHHLAFRLKKPFRIHLTSKTRLSQTIERSCHGPSNPYSSLAIRTIPHRLWNTRTPHILLTPVYASGLRPGTVPFTDACRAPSHEPESAPPQAFARLPTLYVLTTSYK